MAGQDASAGTSASVATSVATTQVSQSSASSASAAPSSTPSKTAAPGQEPTPPSSAPSQTDAAPSSLSSPDKAPTTSSVTPAASKPAASGAPSAITSSPNTPTGPARPAAPDSVSATSSASSQVAISSEQVHGVSSSSSSLITSPAQTYSLPVIPIPLPVSTSVAIAPSIPTAPVTTQSTHAVILRPPGTEVVSFESQPVLTPLSQTHAASQAPAEPVTTPVPQSTSSAPAPPSDPSPTSVASSDESSKSASGIQQANAKTPTTTSTVTDKPETTLSTPVFITVTDAKKHTTLSEPPVFTSVGVSTLSDGQLVSVTHVIANPTGIWSITEDSAKSGFFADSKAVAGVFLAIGIVIAAIGLGICFFLRRRRRRTPRFMNSISRPLPMPDNPFEDPRSLSPQPQMRYASGYTDRTLVIAGKDRVIPYRSSFDDEMEQGSVVHGSVSHHAGSNEHLGLGLAGVGANGRRLGGGVRRSSMESRPRNLSGSSSVGVAVTSDHRIDPSYSRKPETSSARSSPSLYPPTLPALAGEDNRSLVDIPLSANNSTTLVSALPSPTSAARVSSPTVRKPVPAHTDLPLQEPIAPTPLTPQQQRAQETKPPVLPPRSPLRRNSTVRSLSRSPPPPPLASIQTQLQKPEGALQHYEPLTPPASFASVSPSTSHSGHAEPPSPGSSTPASANSNPFADPQEQQLVDIGIPPGHEMVRTGKKDTFYTRLNGKQRRPSVEWKH
ncbi:hypothetical protein OH76DRAFT_1477519 [Lentinus brumalis]|uniref:Uncharacterized protein n=1 Tax=Lentinus brumalis TaxID=2498619 RepID=A0A371DTC7_9APHY|nr:hypothetical protein OH76DRAFT_1477519 [Polyporus brumalis]